MPKITNDGDRLYRGYDAGALIHIAPGETAEVSDEKAAQLEADFPDQFSAPKPKSSSRKKEG